MNSKGRGEFSKLDEFSDFKVFDGDPKSALRLYFVFDLSVLLLENPSSNRLDFGFEFSALGPH